jgi:hypothetical protein
MRIKWPGFNENDCIIIDLPMDTVALAQNSINVFSEVFTPKDELHITIIGSSNGQLIQLKINQDTMLGELLRKTFEDFDWSFRITGPVHLLSRTTEEGIEKTIILLVDMPAMKDFYDQLKIFGLIDIGTPVPPPHITLYTHNCPAGIGVPNEKTLDMLSIQTLHYEEFERLLSPSP